MVIAVQAVCTFVAQTKNIIAGEHLMDKAALTKLSSISGILSGITWTVGDILLVGFKPDLSAYPAIAQSDIIVDKQVAAVMLEGSTGRLMSGALIAAFTVPLMIFALYHIYRMLKPAGRVFPLFCVTALFVAFTWSPLAHASFFYVGEACKTALQMDAANAEPVFLMAATFIDMLNITWAAAIGLTGIGWLLVSAAILRGKTGFPRFFAFLTPLPLSVLFIGLYYAVPNIIPDALAGAGFNVAAIIFYAFTAAFCFRKASTLPVSKP
jgi:hypothetical protein